MWSESQRLEASGFPCIVVKEAIEILTDNANENDKAEKNVAFKYNASFRSRILKFNSTIIENAEDLDTVMPMYNLLEYSQNYSMTSGNLWSYYRDEIDDIYHNTSDGKSIKYKTKIVGKTPSRPENEGDPNRPEVSTLNVEITIPLKTLQIFRHSLM